MVTVLPETAVLARNIVIDRIDDARSPVLDHIDDARDDFCSSGKNNQPELHEAAVLGWQNLPRSSHELETKIALVSEFSMPGRTR